MCEHDAVDIPIESSGLKDEILDLIPDDTDGLLPAEERGRVSAHVEFDSFPGFPTVQRGELYVDAEGMTLRIDLPAPRVPVDFDVWMTPPNESRTPMTREQWDALEAMVPELRRRIDESWRSSLETLVERVGRWKEYELRCDSSGLGKDRGSDSDRNKLASDILRAMGFVAYTEAMGLRTETGATRSGVIAERGPTKDGARRALERKLMKLGGTSIGAAACCRFSAAPDEIRALILAKEQMRRGIR